MNLNIENIMETLTEEQRAFVVKALNMENHELTLDAPGGTGKTFTIKALINILEEQGFSYVLLATTHKACSLYSSRGMYCATIHRFLRASQQYDAETGALQFAFEGNTEHYDYIIIDEVSMIKNDLYDTISNYAGVPGGPHGRETKIIYTGDRYQLPPVGQNGKISKVFTNPIFTFTKNIRVNKNRDSKCAQWLKTARSAVDNSHIKLDIDKQDRAFMLDTFYKGGDIILLAWTNNRVNEYNRMIRSYLFNTPTPEMFYPGEKLCFGGFRKAQIDDRSFMIYHTSDILDLKQVNKCEAEVPYPQCDHTPKDATSIKACDECGIKAHRNLTSRFSFYELTDQHDVVWKYPIEKDKNRLNVLMKEHLDYCKFMKLSDQWRYYYDIKNNFMPNIVYNYAMTVHKAQGSEFDTVFIDVKNIRSNHNLDERSRMLYTALSRLKRVAYCI